MAYQFDYQNRWSDDPDSSLPLGKRYAERAIQQIIRKNRWRDL